MQSKQRAKPSQTEIIEVPYGPALESVFEIRSRVFVDEQHLTSNARSDPDDRRSIHYLASVDGEPVGTGRLTILGREAQIAWVAVLKEWRKFGIGRALMEAMIERSKSEQADYIVLNAQVHALEFYRRLGFHTVGQQFVMARIPHQVMVRGISPQGEDVAVQFHGLFDRGLP